MHRTHRLLWMHCSPHGPLALGSVGKSPQVQEELPVARVSKALFDRTACLLKSNLLSLSLSLFSLSIGQGNVRSSPGPEAHAHVYGCFFGGTARHELEDRALNKYQHVYFCLSLPLSASLCLSPSLTLCLSGSLSLSLCLSASLSIFNLLVRVACLKTVMLALLLFLVQFKDELTQMPEASLAAAARCAACAAKGAGAAATPSAWQRCRTLKLKA